MVKIQDCSICFDEYLRLNQTAYYTHNTYAQPDVGAGQPKTIGKFSGLYFPQKQWSRPYFCIKNFIFHETLRPISVYQGRSANNLKLSTLNGDFKFYLPTWEYISLLSEGKAIDNLGSLKGDWCFKKRGANTLLVYLG